MTDPLKADDDILPVHRGVGPMTHALRFRKNHPTVPTEILILNYDEMPLGRIQFIAELCRAVFFPGSACTWSSLELTEIAKEMRALEAQRRS